MEITIVQDENSQHLSPSLDLTNWILTDLGQVLDSLSECPETEHVGNGIRALIRRTIEGVGWTRGTLIVWDGSI
jgi:hypothetical protein